MFEVHVRGSALEVERFWKGQATNHGLRPPDPLHRFGFSAGFSTSWRPMTKRLSRSTSWGSLVRAQYRPPPKPAGNGGFFVSVQPLRRDPLCCGELGGVERAEAEAILDGDRGVAVGLLLRLDELVEANRRLVDANERLEARVGELERRLNRSSRNSSLPPSQDPPSAPTRPRGEGRAASGAGSTDMRAGTGGCSRPSYADRHLRAHVKSRRVPADRDGSDGRRAAGRRDPCPRRSGARERRALRARRALR